MSFRHVEAILTSGIANAAERTVMLALCHHANQFDGRCWPSVERIIKLTGLGERTIRRAIKNLADADLLRIDRQVGRVNIYWITLPDAPIIDQGGGATVAPAPAAAAPPPATVAPEPNRKIIDDASRRGAPASPSGERQGAQDARAILDDWRPSKATTEWFDAKFPEVDMDAQVEAFVLKNQTSGIPVMNPDSAFKGFCNLIPSLKLPPKTRARPGTKAAEIEQNWSDPERRIKHMETTVALYRRMGRDEEADVIEKQIQWMKETGK